MKREALTSSAAACKRELDMKRTLKSALAVESPGNLGARRENARLADDRWNLKFIVPGKNRKQ